jgi:hypothetical protein
MGGAGTSLLSVVVFALLALIFSTIFSALFSALPETDAIQPEYKVATMEVGNVQCAKKLQQNPWQRLKNGENQLYGRKNVKKQHER